MPRPLSPPPPPPPPKKGPIGFRAPDLVLECPKTLSDEEIIQLRVQWETGQRCLADDMSAYDAETQARLRKLKVNSGQYLWNPELTSEDIHEAIGEVAQEIAQIHQTGGKVDYRALGPARLTGDWDVARTELACGHPVGWAPEDTFVAWVKGLGWRRLLAYAYPLAACLLLGLLLKGLG